MTLFIGQLLIKSVLLPVLLSGVCQFSFAEKIPVKQSSGYANQNQDGLQVLISSNPNYIPSSAHFNPRIVASNSNTKEVSADSSNDIPSFPSGFDFAPSGKTSGKIFGPTGVSNSFDYNSASGDNAPSYSSSYGSAQSSAGSSYSPSIPAQTLPQGQDIGQQYTYHYTHIPQGSSYGSHGASGEESSGLFGDLGFGGGGGGLGGLAGLGGLGGLGGLKALGLLAKGILIIKPIIFIAGLLFLLFIPLLVLLIPLPIVTVTQPADNSDPADAGRSLRRQSPRYMPQLDSAFKFLTADQCIERILCKLPQASAKYQSKAKILWDEFGSSFIKNPRVQRGLGAYFEEAEGSKNRNLKCDQKFRCASKFL